MAALLLAAAPLTAADLVEVVDLSGLAASPDGRWVAFRVERPSVARDRVELSWAVVPSDGSAAPVVVADGGLGIANGAGVLENDLPVWRADSAAFVVRARLGGANRLWQVERSGLAVNPLTDASTDVIAVMPRPDGRALLAKVGPLPAAVAAHEDALASRGVRLDGSVDLSIGTIGGYDDGDGEASVRMTGDWFTRRPLIPGGGELTVANMASKQAGWTVPPAPGLDAAAACHMVDCRQAQVVAIVPVPGRSAWVVTRQDRALDQQLFVIADGRARALIAADGLLSGSRGETSPCAVTRDAVFCVAASAGAPPALVRIALADGRRSILFAPNQALAARLPARVERLRWQDRTGPAGNGVLIRPAAGTAPTGLVLQYYRCSGFLRGGVGDELPYQLLALDGIAGLCINRAPPSAQTDRRAEYSVAARSIRAAIAKLTRLGIADPRRIGMQGLSFGSEVTMWMVRRTRLVRAAAIATGQIEASTYWYGALPGRNVPEQFRSEYGLPRPGAGTARWRELSPAADVAAIHTPLLMQLPEAEARWSMELIARLARSSLPTDTFVFPRAAHIKFLPRQKEAAYARNRAWFGLWLDEANLGRPPQAVFTQWLTASPRDAAQQ